MPTWAFSSETRSMYANSGVHFVFRLFRSNLSGSTRFFQYAVSHMRLLLCPGASSLKHLIQLGGFSPLSICFLTLHMYLLFQAVSKSTTFKLLGRPSSSLSIPTRPPCSLSLGGTWDTPFAVQHTHTSVWVLC